MSTQNDFTRTWKPRVAMSAGTRVRAATVAGQIEVCDQDELGVGILVEDTTANSTDSWQNSKVRLWGTGTSMMLVTGAPGTVGDVIYALTTGYAGPASGGTPWLAIGYLLESYTVNGVQCEVAFGPKFRAL